MICSNAKKTEAQSVISAVMLYVLNTLFWRCNCAPGSVVNIGSGEQM